MAPHESHRQPAPAGATAGSPPPAGLPAAAAGRVDRAPLEANRLALRKMVDEGRILGGYALMVAHRGQVIHQDAYGFGDPETRSVPVSVDTIMRVFSLSKTVTCLAVLACHEDGLLHLDDLVEKHIPAWQGAHVVRHPRAQRGSPEDPEVRRKPTVRHLVTHTSGLGYCSNFGEAPCGAAARSYDGLLQSVDSGDCSSLQEFAESLGRYPLRFQPGTRWEYSFGFDVAARIVEVVSGRSFSEYLSQRILKPLCMRDTGFSVPPSHQRRLAGLFRRVPPAAEGSADAKPGTGASRPQLRCIDPAGSESAWASRKPPALCSGGGIMGNNPVRSRGLVSTTRDALRLALMLRNGGVCAETGHRVFKECTVRLLLRNWLPMPSVTGKSHLEDTFRWERGVGYSPLGQIRVYHPRPKDKESSVGEVSHGGWACTYWTFDPVLDLCFAWFAQDPDMQDFTEHENIWMMARRAVGAMAWKPASVPALGDQPRTKRPAEPGEGGREEGEGGAKSPGSPAEKKGGRKRQRSPKQNEDEESEEAKSPSSSEGKRGGRKRQRSAKQDEDEEPRKPEGPRSGPRKRNCKEEFHSLEGKRGGVRRRLCSLAAAGA